jgi:ATP-dependent Clp protease ATP-binding subunit ClpA
MDGSNAGKIYDLGVYIPACPVKRVIQRKVLNELSKQMLPGKVKPKEKMLLDVFDGQVVFREPRAAESVGSEQLTVGQ